MKKKILQYTVSDINHTKLKGHARNICVDDPMEFITAHVALVDLIRENVKNRFGDSETMVDAVAHLLAVALLTGTGQEAIDALDAAAEGDEHD